MADAIIGGLILSTLLSLFVVPSFYVLGDRYFGGKAKPPEASVIPPHA
jgi:Cu/Ag efflux pump CusA